MTADSRNIVAGIEGGGTAGTSLALFAPRGSTAPSDAATAPDAAFLDAGWCSDAGLAVKTPETTKEITAFGTFSPVRSFITASKQTFDVTFLETNKVTLSVYHRKALDALTTAAGGYAFTTGAPSNVHYAAIFEMVDGANRIRAYCPDVQVTGRGDLAIKSGEAVEYPVTLTAFPDSTGSAIYWYYVLDAILND